MASKAWLGTLNNYTDDELTNLKIRFEQPDVVYAIIGEEVAPTTGTPHLQIYVYFASRKTFVSVKHIIGQRAAIFKARGNPGTNRTYCSKSGTFTEFGDFSEVKSQGQRSDLESYSIWLTEQAQLGEFPSNATIANAYPSLFLKYSRRLFELRDYKFPFPELEAGDYRAGWQRVLKDRLDAPPDDRKITVVIDEQGGCGKSWFVRKFLSENPHDAQMLSIGKRDDLAYAIDESKKFFFFLIPRGQLPYLQFSVLESIKDRLVYSPKYASVTKVLRNNVHVVVFTNEEIDDETRAKLTSDRWNIIRIRTLT